MKVSFGDGMLEEMVLEKLRKIAVLKYCGMPEEVRDFECQSHYFLYIWDAKHADEELEFREVKGRVVDMWFEGQFQFRERITLEEMYAAHQAGKCAECEEEGEGQMEQYISPPDEGRTRAYVS